MKRNMKEIRDMNDEQRYSRRLLMSCRLRLVCVMVSILFFATKCRDTMTSWELRGERGSTSDREAKVPSEQVSLDIVFERKIRVR
jgi:hypothetical protein